jgi:alkylation response protein AidB-like acyl-CoA dehydrogenase
MHPDHAAQAVASRRFAAERLAGTAPPGLDGERFRRLAAHGAFDAIDPLAGNRGARRTTALFAALGEGGAPRGLLFAAGAHLFGCLAPLARHGTPSQRAAFLPGLRNGTLLGALAVTEPEGGSSFDTLTTSLADDGALLRLSGRKTLVTNAPDAGLFLVLARQFPGRGPLGLTMLAVPRQTPGLAVRPLAGGGLAGAPMGEVVFSACPLGVESVLGQPGAGLRIFASAMAWERSLLLAGFLGAAAHDLALCAAALTARAGGAPLQHQAVSHRLARMHLRLEAARPLVLAAADALDEGKEDLTAAAMAKLAASEAAHDCALDAARLLAGTGWLGTPFDAAAAVADTLGALAASGTSDIQLDIIARHVIGAARRT